MKRPLNSYGFAAWETALLVAFVVGVVIVGSRIYDATKNSGPTSASTTSSTTMAAETPVTTQAAPAVNSAADLSSAQDAISQVNPTTSNASDSDQLNSLSNF